MTQKRIYDLVADTTPATDTVIVVDKSGYSAAQKVAINLLLHANGAVAGATSEAQSFGTLGIKANVIAESISGSGVTVDSVLCKDGQLGLTTDASATGQALRWDQMVDEDNMTSNSATKVPTQQSVKAYVDSRASSNYGVTWNESTDVYTRTGALAGVTVGSSPGDPLLPIQAAIKRCVINDAGVVQYYLDPTNSALKTTGAASVLTGADGQVMVEIPKFYYKYSYAGSTHQWDISLTPLAGYAIHPAFIKNGVEVSYRYFGAYEGVLYDTSQAVYTSDYNPVASHSATFDVDNGTSKGTITADAGTPYSLLQAGDVIVVTGTADNDGTYIIDSVANGNVITTTAVITGADGVEATTVISAPAVDPANDILSSVNGKKAVTGITRANFRLIAAKRGTGWRITDFYLASAVQLLYLTEYASFYSQSMIGNGLTDWTSATWNTYNAYHPINNSGLSNSNGNTTANTSGGDGVVGSYMSYRGIENWYGHIWEFIDGFNINNNIPYVHNTDTQFADDTAANYTDLGLVLHNANGYPATISQIGTGFLAESVGASSTTKLTDYYYQAAAWRVAFFGGNAGSGASAGGFCGALSNASSHLAANVGGRLCY